MTHDQIMATKADHMARCGVPRELIRIVLEVQKTPALQAAQDGFYHTTVLCGGPGCGKTIAACWLISMNFAEYHPFLNEPGDLPADLRWLGSLFASMSEFTNRSLWDEEDKDFRARALATSLLVLDDVGTERGDGARALESLLSTRIAEGRRTVLTTNLTPEKFEQRYGARVVSRIKGDAGFIHNVHGPDLRARGAA